MEALTKGSHAPRVWVTCVRCGASFERSVVHPYIINCPECRDAIRKAEALKRKTDVRLKCKACRELLSSVKPLGMQSCGEHGCNRQWWSLGNGWYRDTDTDEVFRFGEYRGSLKEASFDEVFRGVRDDPFINT